ncbi:GntR family transcriptional regulator [Rubellimicrobium aerolatum]|uniref:GntR family transcriptional regulator n=1 Tax=Rubellimicrobium aerolatum TaxID=490979 RepID=A0ABW0SC71_9RHOB|nr:GntR family transcriptional regulator [Rubellimicrobium aerolatum]MBP1806281.1 DNA-binding GntR family transcriptional regulator [Rubellimicrobium aerolatum]
MAKDDRATPLYLQVAHRIEQRIADNTWPVGSLLPPEDDLATQMEVSRHTVRQAIAQLRQRGRLTARKGVGTRVEPVESDWRTRFRSESRHDLFDFARETELPFHVSGVTTARGPLAIELGCRSGRKWHYRAGPRYIAGEDRPFCWNEIFLDHGLGAILEGVIVLRTALFQLVEAHTGERIAEIQQEIRPWAVEAEIAVALGVRTGSPGLQLRRRYIGAGGRLLEYAIQSYPETFVYRTTLSSA